MAMKAARQIRRNLTARRLLSFPHFLFIFWMLILLWGERWVFDSKIQKCDWENWEEWVCIILVCLRLEDAAVTNKIMADKIL